ncbi:MAG: VWA domain-containing protein [Deltaproteobacteria bacterium]|nr:VWA domain-containing protein [Deltaproteobacteria bacterium]
MGRADEDRAAAGNVRRTQQEGSAIEGRWLWTGAVGLLALAGLGLTFFALGEGDEANHTTEVVAPHSYEPGDYSEDSEGPAGAWNSTGTTVAAADVAAARPADVVPTIPPVAAVAPEMAEAEEAPFEGARGGAARSAPARQRHRTGMMSQRSHVNAAPAPAALPQTGVLANNFVGGSGTSARLEDLLDRGVMVSGERVQLAAFHERDALPYPRPSTDAVALHVEAERSRVTARGDTVHLQVALLARQGELPRRPRMDIRLVIDRSGSMSGDKFTHAIDAAHQLVRHLDRNDRIGIIAYDSYAEPLLASSRVGDGEHAHAALSRIRPGGGTNISAGLDLALADPPRRDRPGDLGLVVLISDGRATDGYAAPSHLGGLARRLYDEHGVLTTAIGLGTDFDEETMLTIAREGSGSYHFVRRPADIAAILEDELEARAEAVAQALRVRIVLGEGVTAKRVYGSRVLSAEEHAAVRQTEVATDRRIARELGITENRRDEEGGLRMHLPTFRRGDQHVILMELEVPPGRAGSVAGLAHVYLDYKDLYREANGEADVNVTARRVSTRERAVASTERTVKRTVLAFQAGEAMQRAADALASGDQAGAREILRERQEVLEAGARLWRDPLLARDATLLAQYRRVVDGAWNGFGYGDQRTLVMAMGSFADRRMR